MSFYGSIGSHSQQQTEDTQESIDNIEFNSFEGTMYDYIAPAPYKEDADDPDTLSLFDFEDESLFEADREEIDEEELSQLLYKDDHDTQLARSGIEFEEESQLNVNISPTPPSQQGHTPYDVHDDNNNSKLIREPIINKTTNAKNENEENIVIPDNVIKNISNKLVERKHHYHLTQIANKEEADKKEEDANNKEEGEKKVNTRNNNNVYLPLNSWQHYHNNYNNAAGTSYSNNWQRSMWKSHGGARRFFMPLPNRRFMLMHHHEIEQVLRKQLSHMMLPDPLSADFYCGVTQAREGKIWEGFGVPGPGHVYIAKSAKYPKHNDGSPILPPGTLGKTAGFVSVHAPKSMISIAKNLSVANETESECKSYDYRELCREIECGYDHLMLFEQCNASIFYVHEESKNRMFYATENGLINSRTQRDDMNIFNICLESRDQRLKNLIIWCNLNNPHEKLYRLLHVDKGRKLMYRIFGLFEADDAVFIAMLKLLCAKIYLFATCDGAKKVCSYDIEFGDKLKAVLNPAAYYKNNKVARLSSADALCCFKLIVVNLRSFKHISDRQILCSSRLICALLSIIIKISRSNEAEWIEMYQQFVSLFDCDLSFLFPSESSDKSDDIYINGTDVKQWRVLQSSARIRWELISDLCLGMDESNANKVYNLSSFWEKVAKAMWYYPSARFLANKHSSLKEEIAAYLEKTAPSICPLPVSPLLRSRSQSNPYSTAGAAACAQSMHHYVNAMRRWLAAFKQNEKKQIEKERQHQINIRKQTKRQREYDKMLQQKKDLQNQRFKQQFFKALKEKNVEFEINQNNKNKHVQTRMAIAAAAAYKKPVKKRKLIPVVKKKKEEKEEEDKKKEEISDNVSSCSSSDTASFLSLGIGVDPFDLNKRYYQNIVICEEEEEKKEEVIPTKKKKKNQEDPDDETLMMLAHGMQQVDPHPQQQRNCNINNNNNVVIDEYSAYEDEFYRHRNSNNHKQHHHHRYHYHDSYRDRDRSSSSQQMARYNKRSERSYLISPASEGSSSNRNRYSSSYGYNHHDDDSYYYHYYQSQQENNNYHYHENNNYHHHNHHNHHHHRRSTNNHHRYASSTTSATDKKRDHHQYNAHRYRSKYGSNKERERERYNNKYLRIFSAEKEKNENQKSNKKNHGNKFKRNKNKSDGSDARYRNRERERENLYHSYKSNQYKSNQAVKTLKGYNGYCRKSRR